MSCPSEGKSKFTDAFIKTVCEYKGFLPDLKNLQFLSKFPLGFNSVQKLVESLNSLEYIGSMEMFTKLSKVDVTDLVSWVKDKNWDVVIGYKGTDYNVFSIDQSDPWKFKYVPDKGRVPVKRKLSIPVLFSDDEGDLSKRSSYLSPSVCSAKKSGSMISMKKSVGSNGTPVNIDNEDFEFEFAMDSDGFIKNKDYKMNNYGAALTMNDEDEYDDYDEFDEDTMDVEDLPEDAEFEWCWGEDGNLKIYEIDRNEDEKAEIFDQEGNTGQSLLADEQNFLENHETEMSIDEPSDEIKVADLNDSYQPMVNGNIPLVNGIDNPHPQPIENGIDSLQIKLIENGLPDKPETSPPVDIEPPKINNPEEEISIVTNVKSKSESRTKTKAKSRSKKIQTKEPSAEENASSISSRKAKKRTAQLTPPPTTTDDAKPQTETGKVLSVKTVNGSNTSVIPSKAAKSDNEHNKAIKIASIFEKQLDNAKVAPPLPKSTPKPILMDQPRKQNVQAPPPPKTQVIEVFEYDPLLGYCTVKRKTVPINEVEEALTPVSINMSFLNSNKEEPVASKEDVVEDVSKQTEDQKESIKDKKTYLIKEEDQSGRSSNSSSKENKLPTNQTQQKNVEKESPRPLLHRSSLSNYDNPLISAILEQAIGKPIPEPPKCKPPCLPDSVGQALRVPPTKRSVSLNEDEDMAPVLIESTSPEPPVPSEENPPVSDIKVEVNVEKETEVNVTVKMPEKPTGTKPGCPQEAKEFYWDYEESCWKECDPDEEYEWEYIDSEEEKALEEVADKQKLSVCRAGANVNEESIINISIDAVCDSNKDQSNLQREASKYSNIMGMKMFLCLFNDIEKCFCINIVLQI